MSQKEKFEQQFKTFLNTSLPSEILSEENNRDYLILLASTYFINETTQDKLVDYITELIEDSKVREPLILKIKSLKEQCSSSDKPKQAPKKSVGERLKVKSEEKQKEKEKEVVKPKEKEQNLEGQPKKRVKKDIDAQQGEGEKKIENQKAGLKKKLQSEGKQKCRFFPFCKNEENCEFFHPSQKVKFFKSSQKQKQNSYLESH